jgi:hypothetical protein
MPDIFIPVTNAIESIFSTARHRTKVTRGPGYRAAGLAMAFKITISAETRWRAVNRAQLVAIVRAGAKFVDGRLAGRPEDQSGETPVEAAA